MIMKTTSIILFAVCLGACAGSGASRTSAAAGYCPVGSVKVCTSLFEPSKERIPNCACSELISSR